MYPHISPDRPLMVVVDTSVFMHLLDHGLKTLDHKDAHYEGALKANLLYLYSGEWLPESVRPLLKQMVFCLDSKPYWRAEWLADVNNLLPMYLSTGKKKRLVARWLELKAKLTFRTISEEEIVEKAELENKLAISYKAGRKLPEYRFKKTKNIVLKQLKRMGATIAAHDGYEADDMAAAIVGYNTRTLNNGWSVLLLTVDTDWLGLVNHVTTWVCMKGYSPRVRDTLETCNLWAEQRLGTTLETWRDIWEVKGEQGDKSDNLPPSDGHLLPVIDLLNPPQQHRYWLNNPSTVGGWFGYKHQQVDTAEALSYLRKMGTRLVIQPMEGEEENEQT